MRRRHIYALCWLVHFVATFFGVLYVLQEGGRAAIYEEQLSAGFYVIVGLVIVLLQPLMFLVPILIHQTGVPEGMPGLITIVMLSAINSGLAVFTVTLLLRGIQDWRNRAGTKHTRPRSEPGGSR